MVSSDEALNQFGGLYEFVSEVPVAVSSSSCHNSPADSNHKEQKLVISDGAAEPVNTYCKLTG